MNLKSRCSTRPIPLVIFLCLVLLLLSILFQYYIEDSHPTEFSDDNSSITGKSSKDIENKENQESETDNNNTNVQSQNNSHEIPMNDENNSGGLNQNGSVIDDMDSTENSSSIPSNQAGNSGSSGHGGSQTQDNDSDDANEGDEELRDCIVVLPSYHVTANISYDYDNAYFITDINGIYTPCDIQNDTYLGWCIDLDQTVNTSLKNVTLYSSFCPPEHYQVPMENWSAVNYILNHKFQNAAYWDIQTAIWYYVNIGTSSENPTEVAWEIISNVTNNNGTSFIPNIGDIIAVIVEPVENSNPDQRIIIEVTIPNPRIELEKTVNITSARIGDMINYSYKIKNTGTTLVHDLELYDDQLGFILLNSTSLGTNQWATGSKTYTVIETDLPGPIVNTAFITGVSSTGRVLTENDSATVFIHYNSMISIQKTVDKPIAKVGDLITYTYNISNIGDVTLSNITIKDDLLGTISTPFSMLISNEWMVANKSYIINRTDLPGPIINTAFVMGYDPLDQKINDTDQCQVHIQSNTSLAILKKANQSSAHIGDMISYTYYLENTGDTSLFKITMIDDKLGAIPLNITTLLPGENISTSLSYEITCSDASQDFLQNTVNVSAVNTQNQTIYNHTSETIEIIYEPNITLNKTVFDPFEQRWKESISVIESSPILFNITIQNNGKEELTNIRCIDKIPVGLVFSGQASISPTIISPHQIEWDFTKLLVNETISFTYQLYGNIPGSYQNDASVQVETCNQPLISNDSVPIVVLECPFEIWVNDEWQNQTIVDMYDTSLVYHYTAFQTIQQAIDIVCECGKVYVLNGTYNEQIIINKNIELLGTSNVIIKAPETLKSYTINGTNEIWAPIVFATGGDIVDNNVIGDTKISVKIDGIKIDGKNKTSPEWKLVDILYWNIQTSCINNEQLNCSIQNSTYGIVIWNSDDLLIKQNLIQYHDIGILIKGITNKINISYNWIIENPLGVLITTNNTNIENDSNTFQNISIQFNYFFTCSWTTAIENQVKNTTIIATYNYYGASDGPASPLYGGITHDAITGRKADGNGEVIIGNMHFDPWCGVEANSTISMINTTIGNRIHFNASDSFAYTGYIGDEDWNPNNFNYVLAKITLDKQYLWDFGDGHYSNEKATSHVYTKPGVYEISLRIYANDVRLHKCDGYQSWKSGTLYDWNYYQITVT